MTVFPPTRSPSFMFFSMIIVGYLKNIYLQIVQVFRHYFLNVWDFFFGSRSLSNIKIFALAKECRCKSKITELASAIVRNTLALKTVEVNLGYDGKMADHVGLRKVGQMITVTYWFL